MITKDGYGIIGLTGLLLLVALLIVIWSPGRGSWTVCIILGALFLFHLFFFRDPERNIPEGDRLILSPADGRIVKIEQVEDHEFVKEKAWKVSIFLSVLNVHVNRMPITGEITFLDYKKGQFLAAFNHRASELNEQSIIGIRSEKGNVLFKQIAGVIARRIVYHCKKGDTVKAGERFGMIRYGSRVDVFFPATATVKVKLKDTVKGGATVIGEFAE